MNDLVNADELLKSAAEDNIVLFDCRFSLMDSEAGKAAYKEGHIPGAIYSDLNKQLSSPHIPGQTGRHPLPGRNDWIRQVQLWGITPECRVVVYDDVGGVFASRLWWLLRWVGHANVAVLNGGWQAWLAAGGESETQIPEARLASDYDYSALQALSLTIDVANIDSSKQVLLDAREQKRFDGDMEPIDPVAGHIPGALCSPTSENLDDDGKIKPAAELREKFAPALAENQKEVVCYCGSGVSAAHNILAMRIAGIEEPSLYVGSWSEWVTDPARPIATKAE
ncbi:MAG: sulfurtransferase [Gammaproteobacteria bacterium]|nr:sulfurtransferase [Gammaproteobacteria bacterium]